jgi:hypothetical protein
VPPFLWLTVTVSAGDLPDKERLTATQVLAAMPSPGGIGADVCRRYNCLGRLGASVDVFQVSAR